MHDSVNIAHEAKYELITGAILRVFSELDMQPKLNLLCIIQLFTNAIRYFGTYLTWSSNHSQLVIARVIILLDTLRS